MHAYDYDLIVIGSGPSGQKAAIQAAKLDKRVAVVERTSVLGGVCINTGTIPSKTLREAAIYLTGYRLHTVYGESYAVKQRIGMADLLARTDHVMRTEIDVVRHQLQRNRVDVHNGLASFVDPHRVRVEMNDGGRREFTAANFVIAVGTCATEDSHIPFDGRHVLTSDDILELTEVPKSLTVVGAGVIGLEYASIFAALGCRVTLVDTRARLLPFVDGEIIEALAYHLRQQRATLRLGEEVETIEVEDGAQEGVLVRLKSGKQIRTDAALYSIGRTGATAGLNLAAAGLEADHRGRLKVDDQYRTAVPHIYAAGDVIGFPSLASSSMEQGRLACCHAFGIETASMPHLFPYGIYSVPEISMVGKTEEELTADGVPYETGRAAYKEVARGQILGDVTGLLKLIFHLETRAILGVHIIGESACELIHIGQSVMAFDGTVDYFVNTVFNYPTLAECYKIAGLDGINRLNG
ncbi:MAG: Si-specific NAD(P)(+) transhydrogenase [Gemmatimonadota bacterium]|jgi:NAD(P) transhydrogenase